MLIRDADPLKDAAACAAIYAPFVRETAVSFEEVAPDTEEMHALIERICARYPWLVAELEGEVAGFAYASRHRERAAYRWAADVTVYVADGHREQGVGKALYGELFELLPRQGIQIAVAGITIPNPASVALHESMGFELVGIYRRIGWKLGAWHDVGWWQRELVAAQSAPIELGPPERIRR